MKTIIRSFQELSLIELYDILKLRQLIFIVEQDCAYLDADDKDQASMHICFYDGKSLMAYARVLPEGLAYSGYVAIGRVVVNADYRRRGLGTEILKSAIEIGFKMGDYPIKLSAQCYALDLYSNLGFKPIGETYLEDGIPHQAMVLSSQF